MSQITGLYAQMAAQGQAQRAQAQQQAAAIVADAIRAMAAGRQRATEMQLQGQLQGRQAKNEIFAKAFQQGYESAFRRDQQSNEEKFRKDLLGQQQTFEAGQNQAERASREKIATERAKPQTEEERFKDRFYKELGASTAGLSGADFLNNPEVLRYATGGSPDRVSELMSPADKMSELAIGEAEKALSALPAKERGKGAGLPILKDAAFRVQSLWPTMTPAQRQKYTLWHRQYDPTFTGFDAAPTSQPVAPVGIAPSAASPAQAMGEAWRTGIGSLPGRAYEAGSGAISGIGDFWKGLVGPTRQPSQLDPVTPSIPDPGAFVPPGGMTDEELIRLLSGQQ